MPEDEKPNLEMRIDILAQLLNEQITKVTELEKKYKIIIEEEEE